MQRDADAKGDVAHVAADKRYLLRALPAAPEYGEGVGAEDDQSVGREDVGDVGNGAVLPGVHEGVNKQRRGGGDAYQHHGRARKEQLI